MMDPETWEILPKQTDVKCDYAYVLITGEYEKEKK
jgi:hypothetical protein